MSVRIGEDLWHAKRMFHHSRGAGTAAFRHAEEAPLLLSHSGYTLSMRYGTTESNQ